MRHVSLLSLHLKLALGHAASKNFACWFLTPSIRYFNFTGQNVHHIILILFVVELFARGLKSWGLMLQPIELHLAFWPLLVDIATLDIRPDLLLLIYLDYIALNLNHFDVDD